jgi:hypothetical protein
MSKKLLSVVLAATMVLIPFQGQLLAASPVVITAQGTLGAVSTLTVTIRNIADNSVNGTGLGFNAASGAGVVTSSQYLDVEFNDNSVGFQSLTMSTDNRDAAANPKYTGPAQGGGLVGVTDTTATVPLAWTVFDSVVASGTGYSFEAAINSASEFFLQDKRQGEAAECTDDVTGAFESGGDCDGNDPIIDWDGDGTKGAKAYDTGFASVVSGIGNQSANIADASGYVEATSTAGPTGRSTTDGQVYVYMATDYQGAAAQEYKTSKLTLEIVTIA